MCGHDSPTKAETHRLNRPALSPARAFYIHLFPGHCSAPGAESRPKNRPTKPESLPMKGTTPPSCCRGKMQSNLPGCFDESGGHGVHVHWVTPTSAIRICS